MTDAQPPPPPPAPPATDGGGGGSGPATTRATGAAPAVAHRRGRRAGQLTTAWQIMVASAWTLAFFALAGVWKASEEVGIATWWLGPRADPQPVVVRILPFVVTVAVALCAVYNVRAVSWISLVGTAALTLMAAIDLSYMTGLALAEFVVAGGVGMVSIASFGGRYRRAPHRPAGPPPPEPGRAPAAPTATAPPPAGPPPPEPGRAPAAPTATAPPPAG